ncbi:hypothetical protein [Streptomyces sp. NPDC004658]|uniref:hypothetical protein n=1 Tax=Streptomyces sp. NPDC004658 TaxID=3154672 RepID=UPI0033B558A0
MSELPPDKGLQECSDQLTTYGRAVERGAIPLPYTVEASREHSCAQESQPREPAEIADDLREACRELGS